MKLFRGLVLSSNFNDMAIFSELVFDALKFGIEVVFNYTSIKTSSILEDIRHRTLGMRVRVTLSRFMLKYVVEKS